MLPIITTAVALVSILRRERDSVVPSIATGWPATGPVGNERLLQIT